MGVQMRARLTSPFGRCQMADHSPPLATDWKVENQKTFSVRAAVAVLRDAIRRSELVIVRTRNCDCSNRLEKSPEVARRMYSLTLACQTLRLSWPRSTSRKAAMVLPPL